jgi:hypothetical protein
MTDRPIDLRYLLNAVGSNLWASLVPLTLIRALGERPIDPAAVYRGLTELYFSLLPGALTLSLSLFLLCRLIGLVRHKPDVPVTAENTALVAFLGLGTLAAAFLHPLRVDHGIAHAALFSSVVLLVALAWGALVAARPFVTAVVCLGMITEFLAMFWSHVWLVDTPEMLDPYHFNVTARTEGGLVFLNEALAVGKVPAIVATAGIEVALVAALGRRLIVESRAAQSIFVCNPPRSELSSH